VEQISHEFKHTLMNFSVDKPSVVIDEKVTTMDFYGHPTGIRSVALSSDDRLACTVSKDVTKIWNVASRTCIQSLSSSLGMSGKKKTKASSACYGLCATFLPGNTHVAVGTREGHLLLIDVTAGDVVYAEEGAHDGAIWSVDVRRRTTALDSPVTLVTGSADKSVKFWTIEAQDSDGEDDHSDGAGGQPMFVQTRALQMTDDVISVGYSKTTDSSKRLVFVSTLDCTIKVFFDDSLKMFLSLYGHKLPALAVDCSDDDVLLASCGGAYSVLVVIFP
jgi:U3 small nucleolar RNA-associated protein 12